MPSAHFHVPPEPTVQMRLLRAVALLILGMLLPRSVQADAVTFITTIGADFQGAGGTVAGLSGGLALGGSSDVGGHFLFSSPLAPVVRLAAHESVGTGPLVAHTGTSWTFHGGGVVAESDGEATTTIPIPPGYATCEAAGFATFTVGTGRCVVNDPALNGTLTGDVVLSLSNVVPDASGGFLAGFDLTGPITFGITPGLARAGGVSVGPYFGSLTVQGFYFQDTSFDGQPEYRMTYDLFEVTGVTAPEPSTLLLLAAAAGIALLVSRSHRVA
jgi:hypothetical protein